MAILFAGASRVIPGIPKGPRAPVFKFTPQSHHMIGKWFPLLPAIDHQSQAMGQVHFICFGNYGCLMLPFDPASQQT